MKKLILSLCILGLIGWDVCYAQAPFIYNPIPFPLPTSLGGSGLSTIGSSLQVLRVNAGATALEFATPSSGASNLSDLGDVSISSPANYDILQYSTVDSKWHNNIFTTASFQVKHTSGTHALKFDVRDLTGTKNFWWPDATDGDYVVTLTSNGTIQNKTFASDGNNGFSPKYTFFTLRGSSDTTKALRFSPQNITTGTTRTLTSPDADGTIATLENDKFTAFTTPVTSANVFGVVSDETGSGLLVGSVSPTLTGSPKIGVHTQAQTLTLDGSTGGGVSLVLQSNGSDIGYLGNATYLGIGSGNDVALVTASTTLHLGASATDTVQITSTGMSLLGNPIYSVFGGTSASLGGSALLAGQCSSNTTTITGVTTAMAVIASPTTYPGDGSDWKAYVSAADTVTTKVCAIVALTPTASTYNLRVLK